MYPIIRGAIARTAFTSALVAGALLSLSATVQGFDATAPAEGAGGATQPDRILLAQADTTAPVSYSREQAARGEDRYASECEECHGDDLRGGLNGGPPLRGMAFEQKFANGAPASAMFLFMSTLMPPNAPGRFSEDGYADLMAFILQENGFQPGAELPSDVDALDRLIVEK
ncbi:c-type cytochrome [Pelagibacterium xiamenense]|uniref:c-type cytochrome n=1 Tax=Pelagibacterium xiamenense TaxID=2901140 RepID=UPI001E35E886|nr:cytochrome c [Pelagibacterium xiamenense]MCD7061392.1 cytochrome c [Pelagibacterium xiamenense]